MACPLFLYPVWASLFAAQLAASVPIEPETEAHIADSLPDQFIQPDAEQIAIEKDRLERMTVSVRIDQGGPYAFIIDTASQRTILSKEIAGALALDIEDEVTIVALAGSTVVQTVFVPSLTLGKRSYDGLISPTFRSANIGADGVLGLDSLQGQRILFDFLARNISIEDTSEPLKARSHREIVVTARRRSGQLIFTNATIAGVRTSVIIDTGGELSIGNKALQRRLRLKSSAMVQTNLVDVTGRSVQADYGIAEELLIGRARFGIIPIAFADIAPFKALKLDKSPALFLGMDALRKFDRVAIDFANRKIYFLIPKDA
ncbi:MAG: putative aspartyl protease [Parasphingorhabdus sp.]|jgi:predicted aspartyl protease|uniref:aspartyl protease family protein n=1 Tax=Parasphingorhabdus sp. TaxID=2709688 RepID=UPI0039E2BF41